VTTPRTVALAAPHHDAVAAGRRAIDAGGNAVDAALAAATMLTVVYPHQCALGGDLIALVQTPAGETLSIVSAGAAPRDILSAAATWTTMPRQGPHPVTIPGIVAGWLALEELGARLPLADALTRAAGVAADGTEVSPGLERAIDSRIDAVRADPGLSAVFAPGGGPLRAGDTLVQPALAETLRRLAADPRDIYTGRTARRLVAGLRAAGGTHFEDDFAEHVAEVGPALAIDAAGARWHVAPPPSVGALLLGLVSTFDEDGHVDGATLLDAALRGVQARAEHLGDPRTAPVNVEALLSLGSRGPRVVDEPPAQGDTVAVTASDDEGWSVTLIQSVFHTFGSGMLEPETGIVLHNRGGAFSLDPASPARLTPGSRPPHTLCPVIVEDDESAVIAGCQGGRAQPWILSQLLPALRNPDIELSETLAVPRWLVGDVDLGQDRLSLVIEPGADPAVIARAEAVDLPIARFAGPDDSAGHVQVIRRTTARTTASGATLLEAASDPRADGAAIVRPAPSEHHREDPS
jgi:gamma-glutamyltranspeptidase